MAGLLTRLFKGKASLNLDAAAWAEAMAQPVFGGLGTEERARLRKLAAELLADKTFSGAAGAEVDEYMATVIAGLAALPVLNLGYGWYKGWQEIVVYPGEFVHEGEHMDEDGVVHHVRHVRSGEAMEGGPMVLSWDDVAASGGGDGYNVVIHEFAHKLDMKNGEANGRPPLHPDMSSDAWARAFGEAYADLCRQVDAGLETAVDAYASESPAEFFAVLTEYFFEAPAILHGCYPAVYEQLRLFYRQNPLKRLD